MRRATLRRFAIAVAFGAASSVAMDSFSSAWAVDIGWATPLIMLAMAPILMLAYFWHELAVPWLGIPSWVDLSPWLNAAVIFVVQAGALFCTLHFLARLRAALREEQAAKQRAGEQQPSSSAP